jgi:hypothetical protein
MRHIDDCYEYGCTGHFKKEVLPSTVRKSYKRFAATVLVVSAVVIPLSIPEPYQRPVVLKPTTDYGSTFTIRSSSGDATFSGDVVIEGDLTVHGEIHYAH